MPVALVVIGSLFGFAGAFAALLFGLPFLSIVLAWYLTAWIAVLISLVPMVLMRHPDPQAARIFPD